MKIIDRINEKVAKGEPFFSFEYFPPRTAEVGAIGGGCWANRKQRTPSHWRGAPGSLIGAAGLWWPRDYINCVV